TSVMDDAAQARSDDAGIAGALLCRSPIRMEFLRLSGRKLVLQPLYMAAAVRLRGLVRAWRRPGIAVGYQVEMAADRRHPLSSVCSRDDDGGPFRNVRRTVPEVAL